MKIRLRLVAALFVSGIAISLNGSVPLAQKSLKIIAEQDIEVVIPQEILPYAGRLQSLLGSNVRTAHDESDWPYVALSEATCQRIVILLRLLPDLIEKEPSCFIPRTYGLKVQAWCNNKGKNEIIDLFYAAVYFDSPILERALYWVLACQIPEAMRAQAAATLQKLSGPISRAELAVCTDVLKRANIEWIVTLKNMDLHYTALSRCALLLSQGYLHECSMYDLLKDQPALAKSLEVDLKGRHLTSIYGIGELSADITLLDLSENAFGEGAIVSKSPFERFKRLQELRLISCGFRKFSATFFHGLATLKRLFLCKNCLEELPSLVESCPELETLEISENKLGSKPLEATCKSVFVGNAFHNVTVGIFMELENLQSIFFFKGEVSAQTLHLFKQNLPNVRLIFME